jgi:hypothetical protein
MIHVEAAQTNAAPKTEREVLDRAGSAIRNRLPEGWSFEALLKVASAGGRRADAIFQIEAPDQEPAIVFVEAKNAVQARDVPGLARRLRGFTEGASPPPSPYGLVAARYLSAPVRERLREEGLNYVDATGNLFLSLEKPALFLRDTGAASDPWRGPGRPRDSFRGQSAARVIRALVDFSPPMSVPRLIERSGASTGAVYRVVDFLERQDLLEREPRKPITRVEWRQILERWSRDYDLNLAEAEARLLEPRGIASVRERLGGVGDINYVLTGSSAAAYFEEYAQTRLAMVYTDEPDRLAERLDLRPVETGANVLLVRPRGEVVYERAQERDGVRVAAPSQIAADLLSGPGREPAEAQALLDWMERNESAWRR